MVAQVSGIRPPRLVVPLWMAKLGLPLMETLARLNRSEPLYTRAMLNALDSNQLITYARASRDLGYSPRPFRETLTDTLAWFAQPRTPRGVTRE